MSRLRPCRVAGCPRTAKARGLCGAHYDRWRRSGQLKPELPINALDKPAGRTAAKKFFRQIRQ